MRANGLITNDRAKALKYSTIKPSTQVSIQIIKRMARVFTLGPTEKYTKGSGTKELNKDLEFGKARTETAMQASGTMEKLKDTGSIPGLMEIDMKDYGKTQ